MSLVSLVDIDGSRNVFDSRLEYAQGHCLDKTADNVDFLERLKSCYNLQSTDILEIAEQSSSC